MDGDRQLHHRLGLQVVIASDFRALGDQLGAVLFRKEKASVRLADVMAETE